MKVRNRGASDTETLWAIIASLARGHGALSDLDALPADTVASTLLGLGNAPEARRAGEWLGRMRAGDVKGLWRAAVAFAGRVAPAIVDHELAKRGYVPLFIDATGIEVDGRLFQWARRDYDGNRGYWLHAAFLGGLWSAGQLQPGGGRVTPDCRRLLDWTAGMVPAGTPVWLRADNAYYKGELVRGCVARGWDYSISVTHDGWRKPVLGQLEGLPDVDLFHAKQHLWAIAKAIYGLGTDIANRWAKRRHDELDAGRIGVVEAGCKRVVGIRFKPPAMHWSVAGVNAMAALPRYAAPCPATASTTSAPDEGLAPPRIQQTCRASVHGVLSRPARDGVVGRWPPRSGVCDPRAGSPVGAMAEAAVAVCLRPRLRLLDAPSAEAEGDRTRTGIHHRPHPRAGSARGVHSRSCPSSTLAPVQSVSILLVGSSSEGGAYRRASPDCDGTPVDSQTAQRAHVLHASGTKFYKRALDPPSWNTSGA